MFEVRTFKTNSQSSYATHLIKNQSSLMLGERTCVGDPEDIFIEILANSFNSKILFSLILISGKVSFKRKLNFDTA